MKYKWYGIRADVLYGRVTPRELLPLSSPNMSKRVSIISI